MDLILEFKTYPSGFAVAEFSITSTKVFEPDEDGNAKDPWTKDFNHQIKINKNAWGNYEWWVDEVGFKPAPSHRSFSEWIAFTGADVEHDYGFVNGEDCLADIKKYLMKTERFKSIRIKFLPEKGEE